MKKQWNVADVNGNNHLIEYKAGFGVKVIVDGQKYKVKSQNWVINIIDFPIMLLGTDVRVVAIGNSVSLAINGVYVEDGTPYVPVAMSVQNYIKVFMGISTIGGFVFSGLLGFIIGLLMSQVYVKTALKNKKELVIAEFIGCTVIQIILTVVIFRSYLLV